MSAPIEIMDIIELLTQNADTVGYIKQSKCIFIMRGLPGSGKTTLTELLARTYPNSVICSADDHFRQEDGSYRLNPAELGRAHELCQQRAREACSKKKNVIMIDNTNIKLWEMKAYIDIANSQGYFVFAVEPNTSWKKNVKELSRRNKHRVPAWKIQQRLSTFEDLYPIYYAWNLNGQKSRKMLAVGRDFLEQVLTNDRVVRELKSNSITDSSIKEMRQGNYFTRQHFHSSMHNLHCTAMFDKDTSHNQPSHRAQSYAALVQNKLASVDDLKITGFVITTTTFSAKVELDDRQLKVFLRDSEDHGNSAHSRSQPRRSADTDRSWRSRDENVGSSASWRQAPRSNARGGTTSGLGGLGSRFAALDISTPEETPLPKGARAHITLGCRNDVNPVSAGDELLSITKASSSQWKLKSDGCEIKYFGDGMFFVELQQPISISTIFAGHYSLH